MSVADIVNTNLLNQALLEKLDKLIIAKAPIPKYNKILSQAYIRKLVKNSRVGNLSQLDVLGAETVTIERKSRLISAQDYTRKAENYLNEILARQYSNVELQVVGNKKDILVPDTNIEIHFSPDNYTKVNSRMCVMLEIRSNGQFFSKLTVWFKVKAQSQAYVLKTDIGEKEPLQKQALEKILVDAINLANTPVSDIDALNSLITDKAISKGQILTHNLLIPKLDVIRGKSVNVIVEVGNVTLYAKAVAKQSGNVGEVVELYNTKNKETFKGIVINENYVRSL